MKNIPIILCKILDAIYTLFITRGSNLLPDSIVATSGWEAAPKN
jgi:hypothetical protein